MTQEIRARNFCFRPVLIIASASQLVPNLVMMAVVPVTNQQLYIIGREDT